MTYNPSIPNPNDLISDSQGQIFTNFGQLNTVFGIDHVTYNPVIAASGMHQFVTIRTISADPIAPNPKLLTFQQSEIYTKSFGTAANRNTELYFAEARETSPTLINLIPTIKAAVKFVLTGAAGAQTLQTTNTLLHNVTSVTRAGNVYTINFTNALDYSTYFVNIINYTNTATQATSITQGTTGVSFTDATTGAGSLYQVFIF